MSQQNRNQSGSPQAAPVGDAVAAERVKVEQFIAHGKSSVAVDLAKALFKQLGSPAAETLLMEAYAARILSLVERGLAAEATALLEQVRQRHPATAGQLREVAASVKARSGAIEEVLKLLADPTLPAEQRARLEAMVRQMADDPARIARCAALPPDHPLRVAAGAVARSLEAATSGPVAAEALALPDVSRQSPLAPWKMMVRAIAAYYAHDDALCEKFLAAVEPGAAAARLAPVLRALMGEKQSLTAAGQVLVKQVDGGIDGFRAALAALDQAMERGNHPQVLQETARVVALCQEISPERLERLKQRISIRALMGGPKADRMAAALGGPTLKNADFWRLLARASEEARQGPLDIAMACSAWEEFRKHAIEEKWFPAFGPEVAALYLHMADLWTRIPDEEIGFVREGFAGRFPGHQHYYAGQPPHIRKLMTEPGADGYYYLDPDALLARACDADPCAENFDRWLRASAGNRRHADIVAELWSEALPREIPPLLHLMLSAEKSNALKKAFKLMERAECLDGLNPEVRRARLRLLVSLATRHLQQGKPRLAEPELRQLEELPQAQQGDRPALAAALRWVYGMLCHAPAVVEAARTKVVSRLGSDSAADFLLISVANACKFKLAPPVPRFAGGAMAGSIGRVCALCADMGVEVTVPYALNKPLLRELSGKNPVPDAAALAALGEATLRGNNIEVAYAVSAAGLTMDRDRWAEFLFLRARVLPDWEDERQSLCAAAASELARRQRNTGLLARIGAWREEDMLRFDGQAADLAMTTEDVDKVVQGERRLAKYPLNGTPDAGICNCPSCRANRAQQQQMPPELERLVEVLGPEELARILEGIGTRLGPKRKRRRRPVFGDDEIPF